MGERLKQLDPRKPSLAIAVALGTFHTTLLVLVVLALVYFFGDLGEALDDLNTLAGLGLFAYLWVIAWVSSAGALRRLEWPLPVGFEDITDAAWRWGAVAGAAIFLVAAAAVVTGVTLYAVATLDHIALLSTAIAVPFALIGSVFAFAFGALFGGLFGLLDYALIRLSETVLDAISQPDVHAER